MSSNLKKRCPECKLVNFATAGECLRCRRPLADISTFAGPERAVSSASSPGPRQGSILQTVVRRGAVLVFAIAFTLFGFYLSLIGSAERLHIEKKQKIWDAAKLLDAKGFRREAFMLNYLTAYRATDNWLNASVEKENAYAATNFPFEIVTIYEEFFKTPIDDTERAAILLHEAQHLRGASEKDAYVFVWKNRQRLGWTSEAYGESVVWRNVRKQTREVAPELFACPDKEFGDCSEQ